MTVQRALLLAALLLCVEAEHIGAEPPSFSHKLLDDRLEVRLGDVTIGQYVFRDRDIPRPYWTGMHAPSGERLTRVHPPDAPDYDDHPTMHPGIWMAFGDINGFDFWRNKAVIEHSRFVEDPHVEDDRFVFSADNVYKSREGSEVCTERTTFTIQPLGDGYVLHWRSSFAPVNGTVVFGDQEEMGLGFRVARPISVEAGHGRIRNDRSQVNEAEIWGKPARWCVYSATLDDRRLGIMVMPHPENFRASWMHARDYGFLAANPFGRNAMTGGEPSVIRIEPGSTLTLRFGLYLFAMPVADSIPYEEVYDSYTAPHEP